MVPDSSIVQERPRGHRAIGRRIWKVARPLLIVYALILLLVSSFQEYLIFPGRFRQGTRDSVVSASIGSGLELVRLVTADGVPIVALHGEALADDGRPAENARDRLTVVYFYGNGSSLARSLEQIAMFRRLGVNVLAADYSGYGMSGGEVGEPALYQTADAMLAYLMKARDVRPGRVVAAGWSLGGAVAIDLASRRPLAGLITFNTFTSMGEMAAHRYPWLPTGFFLRHRFESERKLAEVEAPTLFVQGLDDDVIPIAMAARLEKAAAGSSKVLEIPDAGHEDIFQVGGSDLEAAIRRFFARIEANPQPPGSTGRGDPALSASQATP